MHVGYCKVKRSCFRAFEGKVLGIFVLMIRQFHRNESSWNVRSSSTERKFLELSLPRNESSTGAKVPRSECSMERKFHGSESSLCDGLFAPWNESAEERKGLESKLQRGWRTDFRNRCDSSDKCSVLFSVPEGQKIMLGKYNYPSPQGRTFSVY